MVHEDNSLDIRLDDWQKEFLKCETDKILCTGRQVGKSEVCSMDAAEFATTNAEKTILIIAPTERQAFALFEKTLSRIIHKNKQLIKMGKDQPTKTRIILKNKTKIYCLPTGLAGTGIRFLTIDRLYIDEASRVPDEVLAAVTPMLLTTGGKIIMLSTPAGAAGFFYHVWRNKDNAYDSYARFSINSEEVMTKRPIGPIWTEKRREFALAHLDREKRRMSNREYAQEYLGEFIDDLIKFFPDWLIAKCCLGHKKVYPDAKHYLGVDIARMGEDQTTYEVIARIDEKTFYHEESIIRTKQYTTETEKQIIQLDNNWKFTEIGIDAGSGSLGVGVFDHLIDITSPVKRKVIPLNNRWIALDLEGKKTQKVQKEDFYNNLRGMMERGELILLNDDEVIASLQSVQYEYILNQRGFSQLRIFGNYTHIVEGLIRAAWLAKKNKSLNLWASSISYVRKPENW